MLLLLANSTLAATACLGDAGEAASTAAGGRRDLPRRRFVPFGVVAHEGGGGGGRARVGDGRGRATRPAPTSGRLLIRDASRATLGRRPRRPRAGDESYHYEAGNNVGRIRQQ